MSRRNYYNQRPNAANNYNLVDDQNLDDNEYNNDYNFQEMSQQLPHTSETQYQPQYSTQPSRSNMYNLTNEQPQVYQPRNLPQPQTQSVPQFRPQFQSQPNNSPQFAQRLAPQSQPPQRASRSEKGKATRKSAVFWTKKEDIALARAYVNISENVDVGRDQKGQEFYRKISEMAGEESGTYRDPKSCTNRMDIIKRAMGGWKNAFERCSRQYVSGENEMGKHHRIMDMYSTMTGSDFKFGHVADILMNSSKFNYTTTDGSEDRSNSGGSTPKSGGSGTKRSCEDFSNLAPVEEEAGEYSSPQKPVRPMGTKSSKKKRVQTKLNLEESGDNSFRMNEMGEGILDVRRKELELKERNISLMEETLRTRRERDERRDRVRQEEAERRERTQTFSMYMQFITSFDEATATEELRQLRATALQYVMNYKPT